MELNNIPTQGNWSDTASTISDNFNKVNIEVEKQKNTTTKFKGYFPTVALLTSAVPSPRIGDTAWVGATYPGVVYDCITNGTWRATATVPSTGSVNLTGYIKQSDLTQTIGTETTKAPSEKAVGDVLNNIVTTDITKDKKTAPSNFAVDTLQTKLYGDMGTVVETIPYDGGGTQIPTSRTSWIRYNNQDLFQGKIIRRIVVNIESAGKFKIYAGNTSGSVASWSILVDVVAGKNEIEVNKLLPASEYLFFAGSGNTVSYKYKTSADNSGGGGFTYQGSGSIPQKLCIGVWAVESIDLDTEGDVPNLKRRVQIIEDSDDSRSREVIPYNGTGTSAPISAANYWLRYNNQNLFQSKTIDKIVVNVQTAGKFKIYAGNTSGSVASWSILVDVVAGKNEIEVNKLLPASEYLYFAGAGTTSKPLYIASPDNSGGGGFTYQGIGSINQKLCIGVWVSKGIDPDEGLTEIEKWRKMEIGICKYFAIPCIDVTYTSQISAFSVGSLMPDGVHPNDNGHRFLASAIYPIFSGFLVSVSAGTTYYSLGDSITAGYGANLSYAKLLADTAGYSRMNKAVAGNTIIGDDLINQVNTIPADFSGIVTIMMGVNDYHQKKNRGDVETVLSKNYDDLNRNNSSAEALRYAIETLKRKAPLCKVLVILPFFTTW